MSKKQRRDIGKICTKILAELLALMMLVSVAATLIYYFVMG